MNMDGNLWATASELRNDLRVAYLDASGRDDQVEVARLETLAAGIDRVHRKLALGSLQTAADAVAALRIGERAIAADLLAQARAALGEMDAGRVVNGPAPKQDAPKQPAPPSPATVDDTGPGSAGGKVPEAVADPAPETPPTISPTAAPTTAPNTPSNTVELAWGAVTRKKHGSAFNNKVAAIAGRIRCDASHLMAVMAFETGETFRPDIRNAAGSGATGLIQFMPRTARGLGTTTAKLAKMSALDQLDYVEAYFGSITGRPMPALSDLYMAVLWPAAVLRSESHVLFRKPSRAYTQNRGLDGNRDGVITKAEAAAKVHQKLIKGLKAGRIG